MDDNPFPVSLDTQEPLPLIAMVRRRFDGVGSELPIDRVRWRKLRSYKLVTGIHDAPTTADSLGAALHGLDGAWRRDCTRGFGAKAPTDAIVDLTADDENREVEGDTAEGVDGDTKGEEDVTIQDEVPSSSPWSRNKPRRIERVIEAEVTDAQPRAASDFVEAIPTR
ncbi:hypothetical protein F442_15151 [Phytophthora nicotianae P10297]|uniref:Uncharacterized protein n=1 Tax=Phytophthora nicotianae P10297 TaxID=1317064 RepID=W2YPW2_PHYNI|nr:hypothetical protein F442_15151 [Phytophthora nicotianae P10297]